MAEKIIIDTDPGIDDAMAILLALRSPELEVIGLTSVFGNATIEVTTANALRLVELEGNNAIPVAQGCGQPLVLPLGEVGTYVHGEDGLGNTFPPPPKGRPLPLHAAQFILEALRRFPGEVTLLALGPLTNLALAASWIRKQSPWLGGWLLWAVRQKRTGISHLWLKPTFTTILTRRRLSFGLVGR